MSRGLSRWAALCALCAASCFPRILDETGKLCSLPDQPCAPPFACLAGRCQASDSALLDAGTVLTDGGTVVTDGGVVLGRNLIVNGDFNAGTQGWSADYATLSAAPDGGRNGSPSLDVQAFSNFPAVAIAPETPPVLQPTQGAVYCARAYVAAAFNTVARLSITQAGSELWYIDVPLSAPAQFTPLVTGGAVGSSGAVSLKLSPYFVGEYDVDDVELWLSSTGTCP